MKKKLNRVARETYVGVVGKVPQVFRIVPRILKSPGNFSLVALSFSPPLSPHINPQSTIPDVERHCVSVSLRYRTFD